MDMRARDYRVGMFISLGMLVLATLILLYGEEPTWLWDTNWQLVVHVDTPQGIEEGTPAFLQGVQVGRVSEITLRDLSAPSLGAAVVVEIERQHSIPLGSNATLHPAFGFDKGAIHIQPPPRAKKFLDKEKRPAIQGEMVGALASIVPEEFVESLVNAVEEIAKIGGTAEALRELLEQRPITDVDDPNVDALANLHTLVQRLDGTFKLVNDMIANQGGRENLLDMLEHLNKGSANLLAWTQKLETRTDHLIATVDGAAVTLQSRAMELTLAAVDSLDRLSQVLDQVHKMSVQINSGNGVAGKLLYDAKLYEELVLSVEILESTLQEMRLLIVKMQTEGVFKALGVKF